jgi:integrase
MAGVARETNKSFRVWWIVDKKREYSSIPKIECPSKKEAERRAWVNEEKGVNLSPRGSSIVDIAFKFFDINYSTCKDSTSETFSEMLNWFDCYVNEAGSNEIKDFNDSLIRDYRGWAINKGRSPSSVNRDLSYLKQVGEYCMRKGIIKDFDRKNIKNLKIERKIVPMATGKETLSILSWFKKYATYYYAWMYFLVTRGWRRSEFRKMSISNIEILNQRLIIPYAKTGARPHHLTDKECIVLNEHILLLKRTKQYKPGGLLYPPLRKTKSGYISKNTLLLLLQKACEELKIEKHLTLHSFRHRVVTELLDKGYNPENIKLITGHQDTNTIYKFYAHSNPRAVESAIKTIEDSIGIVPIRVPKKGK